MEKDPGRGLLAHNSSYGLSEAASTPWGLTQLRGSSPSLDAVTNGLKHSSWKQHKCVTSQFWRHSHWAKIKMWTAPILFWRLEENVSPLYQLLLDSCPFVRLQRQQWRVESSSLGTTLSILLSSHLLSLSLPSLLLLWVLLITLGPPG